jgi:hypothetical protein
LNANEWIGKDMRIVTEWLSTREMAEIASRVSGKKVMPMEIDEAAFKAMGETDDRVAAELYRSKRFAVEVQYLTHFANSSIHRNLE